MSRRRFYITTAIPYVNGDPHIGFALECVRADVLARHRRLRGEEVRFLSGTDDNSLKNVEAAEAACLPVADFVNAKADQFGALRDPPVEPRDASQPLLVSYVHPGGWARRYQLTW
jgi:methionyl-tRNA synthetase